MDAIRTKQLCKAYKAKNAVDHIDLVVPEGAVYGIIGRNGSGKTTTQKMVCGLAYPTSGEIKLFGQPVDDPEVRSKIGTLIEAPGVYPGKSALENVVLQGYNIGVSNPKQEAMKNLEIVGLEQNMKKKAKSLSLGMRQRLGIAIAMMGSSSLLVLDEPSNGLDPEGIIELRTIITRLNQEAGITIFMSSHILGELSKIATHYGVINDGKLIKQVSAKELTSKGGNYLCVRVHESEKALELLKKSFDLNDYETAASGELRLYGIDDTGAVNQLLSRNNFNVQEIYRHEQGLEEYFLNLMGAEKVA